MSSPEPERKREAEEGSEQPTKRAKIDDRARGKRLFGNLLGTLQKIQKDDKAERASEAAQRREKVAERIQQKIASETNLLTAIADSVKELRHLQNKTDAQDATLRQTELTMLARHSTLGPTSRFLHTSLPTSTPIFSDLADVAPLPLNRGPCTDDKRPLYFLPKILLPDQQAMLDAQIRDTDKLVEQEQRELADYKFRIRTESGQNRERIAELESRLASLRSDKNHL